MPRTKKVRTDELYGDYDGLSEKQVEYIRLATDPENKLRELGEEGISDMLGVGLKTLYSWRQNPKVREALYKETMYKAADELPSMTTELRKLCTQDKDAKAKVQALALWFKVNGLIADAKSKNTDKGKLRQSTEQRLIELGNRFSSSLIQPTE